MWETRTTAGGHCPESLATLNKKKEGKAASPRRLPPGEGQNPSRGEKPTAAGEQASLTSFLFCLEPSLYTRTTAVLKTGKKMKEGGYGGRAGVGFPSASYSW